ncbi:MAG: hypothetical protein M1835_001519 [Candelina submexicana]|nr:MAG: hypothetical protein M1835_001519 [Candelina submexicana]
MTSSTPSITIQSSSEDEHEDITPPKPARKKRCCNANHGDNSSNAHATDVNMMPKSNTQDTGSTTSAPMAPPTRPMIENSQAEPPSSIPSSSSSSAISNTTPNRSFVNALPKLESASKRKRDDTVPTVPLTMTQHSPAQTISPSVDQTRSRNRLLWSIPPYEATRPPISNQSSAAKSQQRSKTSQNRSIHQPTPLAFPTKAPNSTWTRGEYIDFAITAERSFPFAAFATKLNKPMSEVNDVFSALVQMPAIVAARAPNVESAWKDTDVAEARMRDLRAKMAEVKKVSEREMREFLKKEIKEGVKEGVKKAKEREKVRKAKRKAKAAVARELEMSAGGGISRRKKANGVLTSALAARS